MTTHKPGGTDVLLRAGVDEPELRHIDRAATGCVEDMSATSGTPPLSGTYGKLDAADGLVRRVVHVRGARRQAAARAGSGTVV